MPLYHHSLAMVNQSLHKRRLGVVAFRVLPDINIPISQDTTMKPELFLCCTLQGCNNAMP